MTKGFYWQYDNMQTTCRPEFGFKLPTCACRSMENVNFVRDVRLPLSRTIGLVLEDLPVMLKIH
jgi:hypothetical protein